MSDQITTNPTSPPPPPTCPECGASVRDASATRCWLCREPLQPAPGHEPNPFRLPEPRGDNPVWAVFGVLAMLLLLGLIATGPGILVGLVVLVLPALIRMAVVRGQNSASGARSSGSPVLEFLTSLGVVAVVALAAGGAFFITCFSVCVMNNAKSEQAATALGGFVALLVFGLLIYALTRRRGQP